MGNYFNDPTKNSVADAFKKTGILAASPFIGLGIFIENIKKSLE